LSCGPRLIVILDDDDGLTTYGVVELSDLEYLGGEKLTGLIKGNIMDPIVCTHIPDVKEALNKLILAL
jgi:hypothetical protein